ncbi:pentapeptide repeat-containing protein [Nostoc sp. CENA67]|uniref:Pentapeptide repeat-containing protein n=1 Tax=Amazonocrinis nigriterrae CENA67 TaxID=2794033 RepID=A0A8J7LAE2_9NOST|nr:pentapeptide repeat-containing protein [Amazonocrinis nigriterrae]MBH8565418.1 pentapeptide repeat-containing protein [Amazonocrinis nigriterrae CENA67]
MSSRPGIVITNSEKKLTKKPDIDTRNAVIGIAKAAANAATGNLGNIPENIVDISAAIGLGEEPGQIAYGLIFNSLTLAMRSLVEKNKKLLRQANKDKNVDENELEIISKHRLNQSLEKLEEPDITIYSDFFKRPKDFPIIQEIKTPFAEWLQALNLDKSNAEAISNQLPIEFTYALYTELAKHPDKYVRLKKQLDNPVNEAAEREIKRQLSWQRYSAWLQKQVEEPMFLEAFGLKQVYVPLKAYYQQKNDDGKEEESKPRQGENKEYQKIVVDLETELEAWLEKGDRNDAIRVISGGPGSGKSSFAKIFAANQAEKGKITVLFIPLHHFKLSADFVDAIGEFVRFDGFVSHNPLKEQETDSPLLIIFDGLDELTMQGKIAAEAAQNFVRLVKDEVNRFNLHQTRLQVLISGRELVVQANSSDFRKPQQILHILPYFVVERDRKNYIDQQNFLQQDQRQIWWQKYGNVSGRGYDSLPPDLDKDNLTEITAQPLLNYLVALSIDKHKTFPKDGNLNAIYANLLTAVYERDWAGYQHQAIREVKKEDFVRILEEIALASWHGDGRTTTVKEIKAYCDNSGLTRLLEKFQEGAELGATRLLTAFYFRESDGVKNQEKTFEFTHKSFGEYLTARRIVREVDFIHKQLYKRENNPYEREGWDKKEALKYWAMLCGKSAIDKYLFNYIVDEIRLQKSEDVINGQQSISNLISIVLRYGMPMEELKRDSFQEEKRQSRNAEEALLAVLNTCARVTKSVSNIQGNSSEDKPSKDFGDWIYWLRGQRTTVYSDVSCLDYLSFLDLKNCILISQDLLGAHFEGTNLQDAKLQRTILEWAHFEGANLEWAHFEGANLEGANLEGVNLKGAIFESANLKWTHLKEAHLEKQNFRRANLEGAHLQKADLKLAYLEGVHLEGAHLEGADLGFAYLEGAHLERAHLEGANLKGANLKWVYLEGAHLQGAHLQGAHLQGANLKGVHLEGANLRWVNFDRADLQGAHFEGADLEGARLERASLKGAHLEWPKLLPTNFGSEDLADSEQNSPSDSNEQPASE